MFYLSEISENSNLPQKYLSNIKLSVQVLNELSIIIDDIIDLTKGPECNLQIQPSVLDIETVITEVIKIIDPVKQKGVEMHVIL